MIDFDLTETDRKILEAAHRQALIGRRHARYYDKHEDELAPDTLPEAVNEPDVRQDVETLLAETSGKHILDALIRIEEHWGNVPAKRSAFGLGFGLGSYILRLVGSPEQVARWGDKVIAIAITEPGAGSDPAGIRTMASHDAATNEWVINGEKIFISQSHRADAAMVMTRYVDESGKRGYTNFLVEKGTPGFEVGPQHKKMGIRAWDTASLSFSDCRVPAFNHIKGDFKATLQVFNDSRPLVGAMGLGIARAALDFTREKLAEGGIELDYRPGLHGLSAVAEKLLRLEALYEASWLTVVRSKWLEQRDGATKVEASMAKAKAGRAVRTITQGCVELLGPMALSEEHLIEKWFRDARIFDIFEGPGEVQRLIIARWLLGYTQKELN